MAGAQGRARFSARSCSKRSSRTSTVRPTLVRDGRLPAAVIAGNPEFLRPMVGAAPAGGAHLRFYAVDVGRSPEGRWWVLGDRTPGAVRRRLRAGEPDRACRARMPDIYRALHVERLAPFFQAFQAELSSLNRQDNSRVCVLTPGPLNETYFEHAYLARYLGFLLVEGEDLTVREDGVFIRTVSGLRRRGVAAPPRCRFRRPARTQRALAAGRARSGAGGARWHGGQSPMRSAAGVVEARAMLSFLPALAPGSARPGAGDPESGDVVAGRSRPPQRSPGETGTRCGDRARPLPATSPIIRTACRRASWCPDRAIG